MKFKQKKTRTKVKNIRLNKKSIFMITIIILLVFIIGFGLFSRQSWINYQVKYEESFKIADKDIELAIDKISNDTKSSAIEKLSSLIKVQTKLKNDINSHCNINTLVKWQQFIEWSSDKVKSCENKKNHLDQVISKLEGITDYLKAEQQLADTINISSEDALKNNALGKWELNSDIWKQAASQTDSIKSSEEFKEIAKAASQYFINIADAWDELSKANTEKNRNDFESAKVDLELAYLNLPKISTASQAQFKIVVEKFNQITEF